jgi:hypothetical protein
MNVSAEHPTPHVDEEKKELWRRMISDHRDVIAGEVAGLCVGIVEHSDQQLLGG